MCPLLYHCDIVNQLPTLKLSFKWAGLWAKKRSYTSDVKKTVYLLAQGLVSQIIRELVTCPLQAATVRYLSSPKSADSVISGKFWYN